MRCCFSASGDVRNWSHQEVCAFLEKQNVNADYLEAFKIQKISGAAIYDRECMLIHFMDPQASGQEIGDEILMDALLRTEGWSVKKD